MSAGRQTKIAGLIFLAVLVVGELGYYAFQNPFPRLRPAENAVHLVAVILEIPQAPNPKTTEYSDCLSVAKIQVLKVIEGDGVPLEMLVAFRIINNRILTQAAALQAGDFVELTLLEQDAVDEEVQTMQRIMEVEDFDLQFVYAADSYRWEPELMASILSEKENEAQTRSSPVEQSSVTFQDDRSPFSKERRLARIEADISRIRDQLKKHGNSWEKWVEEVAPWRDKLYKLSLDSDGGILKDGLFYRYFNNTRYQDLINEGEDASAIQMIRALHSELDQLGIDLMVVPFPFKEEVFGDRFLPGAPDDGVMVPERLHMILNLLESGIEVLDVTEGLRSSSDPKSLFYPYEDTHPADGGIQVAAAAITTRLERYGFAPDIYGLKTRVTQFTMPAKFQQRREGRYKFMPLNPSYSATIIETQFGESLSKVSSASPLLILGDSFIRCPDLYGVRGGNMVDHIVRQTGVISASLSVNGSAGQAMSNLALERGAFLSNRQVAVFVFSTSRMFTQKYPEGHVDKEWKIVPFAERFSK